MTNSLPDGIESTDLDAALLVRSLRKIWTTVHRRRVATTCGEVRALCVEIQLLVESEIEETGAQRRAWKALKADLVRDLVDAVGQHLVSGR